MSRKRYFLSLVTLTALITPLLGHAGSDKTRITVQMGPGVSKYPYEKTLEQNENNIFDYQDDEADEKPNEHFEFINHIQPKKGLFFQTNIGVGFLYFAGLKGNLAGAPAQVFQFNSRAGTAPIRGRLSYNRTPLYEYILGARISSCFQVGLSYQYQGGVTVSTPLLPGYTNAALRPQLTSNLSLNAFMMKLYFEFPFAFVNWSAATSFYLGAGAGAGWQSWTRIVNNLEMTDLTANFQGAPLNLRQKISANAVWMLDMGFKFQRVKPISPICITLGCKYNQWGQARNIGKASQHGNAKTFLFQPFSIKTVYQFAPYLGFQWNFSNTCRAKLFHRIDGKSTNTWMPFVTKISSVQKNGSIWTQFNSGIGFLYFYGTSGLFLKKPISANFGTAPFKGHLTYNRTPLFEYLIGYRLSSWFKPAVSYLYQSGITVQTKPLAAGNDTTSYQTIQMSSYLSLNALMAKFYFELPRPLILKNTATSPYIAIGAGGSWQTWSSTQVDMVNSTLGGSFYYESHNLPLRQSISMNIAGSVDAGFRVQNVYPNSPYSITMGCKYSYWGQARNIGLFSKQGSLKYAKGMLFRIKVVNQLAPYLGFQWNFQPTSVDKATYRVGNKTLYPSRLFFTNTYRLSTRDWIWAQFNAGLGFLYFSGVRANFMLTPSSNLTANDNHRDVPFKGRLSYNRTPLFEYQIGTSLFHFLKASLSFLQQGGVSIQTQGLSTFSSTALFGTTEVVFSSRVNLNALLFKLYFESPTSLVIGSITNTPYLAVGVGPGWQTWTQNTLSYLSLTNSYTTAQLNLNQKISANAVFMADFGLKLQSVYPNPAFSLLLGGKFNLWGQAKNIGLLEDQGTATNKFGIFKPLRIKTIYQWAPYVGVQWNF